jgi:hypothetical protein
MPSASLQVAEPLTAGSVLYQTIVTWPGGSVAVQLDGPQLLLHNEDDIGNNNNSDGVARVPSTILRLRDELLRRRGVRVLPVRTHKWRADNAFDTDEFRAWLRGRLRELGAPLPL